MKQYKLYRFYAMGDDIETAILGWNDILGKFDFPEAAQRELKFLCLQAHKYGGNFQLINGNCAWLLNQDMKPVYMLEIIST